MDVEFANENFLLARSQQERKLKYAIKKQIEDLYGQYKPEWYDNCKERIIKELLYVTVQGRNNIKDLIKFYCDSPLYFEFGKYKGRIVQDILEEDDEYCDWFKENVIRNDFNTLLIIDYLVKNGKRPIGNVNEIRLKVLSENVPIELYEELAERTKQWNFLYTEKRERNYGSNPDYKGWHDEDYCSDLCYWGDPLLDYGDLC